MKKDTIENSYEGLIYCVFLYIILAVIIFLEKGKMGTQIFYMSIGLWTATCLFICFVVIATSSFIFNGSYFNWRYRHVCKKSPAIKKLRSINHKYYCKARELDHDIYHECSSLNEFKSFRPESFIGREIELAEIKADYNYNKRLQESYDDEFYDVLVRLNGAERELADTMWRNFVTLPDVTVSWSYSTPAGRKYYENSKSIRIDFEKMGQTPEDFVDLATWEKFEAYKCNYTGIYIMYNADNGKYYVGQAKNVAKRVLQHINGKGNPDLYYDMRNGDNISVHTENLSESEYDNLDEFESEMIRIYEASTKGYNRNKGNWR